MRRASSENSSRISPGAGPTSFLPFGCRPQAVDCRPVGPPRPRPARRGRTAGGGSERAWRRAANRPACLCILSRMDYEKLGLFYLGRPYDVAARQPGDGLILYDSRDLVTHAVCVGMTGSGKTGLCLSLLEEAAIDGIPALIIDP